MSLGRQWSVIALVAVATMLALWLRQRRTRDASPVDVGWAALLGAAALFAAVTGAGDPLRRALVGVMGGGWGLRLAWHLYTDRVRGRGEDGRYQDLRARLGSRAQAWFLVFFQFQALLVVLLATPFLLACAAAQPPGGWDLAAVLVWLLALGGESCADAQLRRFKADPAHRGRTCTVGLWRWSRHPNYFCEWLMWCAYAALAWPGPLGPVALGAPALLLFLVLKVTGIPPTEARALASRGADYRRYQRTTSAFFPWPPRPDPGAGAP